MKYAIVLFAALALCSPAAVAQHAHGDQKGPNGGQMQDVAGVEAEFLATGNTITINIFDEDKKPVASKGYTGSVLVVSGSDRETVALAPSGESALKGETKKPIAPNATITLMLKTDQGKSGQARFKK